MGERSIAERLYATSPLRLLEPRGRGPAAWIVCATLGGGLVDGDGVSLDVRVGQGASLLLGTQASTKVYRSPAGTSQRLVADVAGGALLAVLPDPVTCFEGARYTQQTTVALAEGASLVLLDAVTAGRSARGERWLFDRYLARIDVTRPGAPLLHDALELDPAHGAVPPRMARFDALYTLVVVGPLVAPLVADALALPRPLGHRPDVLVAPSPLGADGVMLRIAARSVEAGSKVVRAALARLADVLGDDPFAHTR